MQEKIGELGRNGLIAMLACCMTVLTTWQLDNDAWFLLNCGRYVESNGIPYTEFATIHENFDYVMGQWLTATIFWKVYNNFGTAGLIDLTWFVGFITIYLYYRICLYVSNGNRRISVILAFFVGAMVSMTFINTRPQVFSTLFLLTEVFLLEMYVHDRKIWKLFVLPFLSILFVNMHSAIWPMMIIVILPILAESLVMKFILKTPNNSAPIMPIIFTVIGIFFAGFINPYGWDAMIFTLNSYDPEIHKNVLEMRSLSVDTVFAYVLLIFLMLTVGAFARKKIPLRYFFLSFGLMILALNAVRALFLFLILGTFQVAHAFKDCRPLNKAFVINPKLLLPFFIICIAELYVILSNSNLDILGMHLPIMFIIFCSVIFCICFIFFYRRDGKIFDNAISVLRVKPLIALVVLQTSIFFTQIYFAFPGIDYEVFKPAVDFLLEKNRPEDIILWTGYDTGGYPEFYGIKCYIDQRAEVFLIANNHKKDIMTEYLNLRKGKLDYREFFSRYNFTHIFIATDDMIPYLMLSNDENYKLIFEYDFKHWGHDLHGKIFVPVNKDD